MIFKRKTSAAKAKEILESYKRLPRPLGSRCGVIRFRMGQNRDRFEVGEIVGWRFNNDKHSVTADTSRNNKSVRFDIYKEEE